jgi:hypothetical protein
MPSRNTACRVSCTPSLWVAALFLCFLVALAARPGYCQSSGNYLQLKVDKNLSNQLKLPVARMRSDGFKSGDEQKFLDYYTKCVLPEWTDPANFAKTASPLKGMLGDLKQARSGPVYDALNRFLLEQMTALAKGNYHPAARYNAMLMIARLNVEEPDSVTALPKPLPAAFPILLASVTDNDLPDAVRYPALLGVVRHGRYGALDEPTRQKVSAMLLSLATMRTPPVGRSKDAHAWIRRVAIEAMGAIPLPGQEAATAKALADVLAETDAPIGVRCEAARAFGQLKLTPQMRLDSAAVARSLEPLLVDIAKEEIRLASEDKQYKIDPRKLKARLISIRAAVTGYEDEDARVRNGQPFKALLALAAKTDAEKLLLAFRQKIENLLGKELLDNPDLVPKTRPTTGPGAGEANLLGGPGAAGPAHGGMPGGMGMGAPGAPGVGGPGGPGMGGASEQLDQAKIISDKIIAELKKIVEEYEKRQAGS